MRIYICGVINNLFLENCYFSCLPSLIHSRLFRFFSLLYYYFLRSFIIFFAFLLFLCFFIIFMFFHIFYCFFTFFCSFFCFLPLLLFFFAFLHNTTHRLHATHIIIGVLCVETTVNCNLWSNIQRLITAERYQWGNWSLLKLFLCFFSFFFFRCVWVFLMTHPRVFRDMSNT